MTNITFYLFFFSTVPVGETLNMTVNISFKIQKSNYLYLGKGSPVIRLIKLRKGEGGSGTCYHEVPECKENYGLRHSGHKTITITIKEVTKLMEGFYRLYSVLRRILPPLYNRPTIEEFQADYYR